MPPFQSHLAEMLRHLDPTEIERHSETHILNFLLADTRAAAAAFDAWVAALCGVSLPLGVGSVDPPCRCCHVAAACTSSLPPTKAPF